MSGNEVFHKVSHTSTLCVKIENNANVSRSKSTVTICNNTTQKLKRGLNLGQTQSVHFLNMCLSSQFLNLHQLLPVYGPVWMPDFSRKLNVIANELNTLSKSAVSSLTLLQGFLPKRFEIDLQETKGKLIRSTRLNKYLLT